MAGFEEYRRWLSSNENPSEGWLAQACHIFNSLDIKSNFEDYGCFAIPDCIAYWSINPSGAERLSAEEARTLGLPDIESWMEVGVRYWDSSVYDGICQFQEAKGFDPYSPDVAIELGYPLFQVSCQRDDIFAHLREVNIDEDHSESEEMFVSEDHESISANAEDALDTEISSNFNSEMNEGLAVVQDVEIVKGRISGDLDSDSQVHEEANALVSDLLEEEEVVAMLYYCQKVESVNICVDFDSRH
ncbi:hypothetical protein K438DRAFT_880804 [Mycena galopus ATCC 62051]|nr:hypothetical protein K438DRAFT_880804 [Mycena galopus ATCC 62051]